MSLNKNHWSNALAIKENMANSGMEEQTVKVHTSEVYKKSFTFPQIAHNDYAVEQFEVLNIAEQNLANDPQNETIMESFLKTADEVATNLKERYKDQWVDPKDDRFTVSE